MASDPAELAVLSPEDRARLIRERYVPHLEALMAAEVGEALGTGRDAQAARARILDRTLGPVDKRPTEQAVAIVLNIVRDDGPGYRVEQPSQVITLPPEAVRELPCPEEQAGQGDQSGDQATPSPVPGARALDLVLDTGVGAPVRLVGKRPGPRARRAAGQVPRPGDQG